VFRERESFKIHMNRHFRFLGAKAFKRNLKGYTDNHNHTHKIPHICTIKVKQQGKKVVVKNNLELKVFLFQTEENESLNKGNSQLLKL
jgi:hypothetical protein